MISRAASWVSLPNDFNLKVHCSDAGIHNAKFTAVWNFFVSFVFPRKRGIFSPRTATLAVKHLVGDVSFLQDNANQELARFVLLVVLVLASSSWSRTSTNDWVHGPDARFWSRRGSPRTASSPSEGERVREGRVRRVVHGPDERLENRGNP